MIGVIVAGGGVLISAKQLPDNWHYGVSAFVAAYVFAYGLLQPYDEYKQFRMAFYKLKVGYMNYQVSQHTDCDLRDLIKIFDQARTALRENWSPPPVAGTGGTAETSGTARSGAERN